MAEAGAPGRRRPRTVRARTTVTAAVVFALALVLGGTALVTQLRQSLVRHMDDVAEARAEDIAALAAQGPLPERIEGPTEDAYVQVLDAAGRIVAQSPNVPAGLRLPAEDRPGPGRDPTTVTVDHLVGLKRAVRVVALQPAGGGQASTILVATSMESTEDALSVVRGILVLGGPLLAAMVAAMTWVGVGRALAPVEAIRSRVADLSSRDLHRRVPVPPTRDEISRLAETMNAMLDRLQEAADRQRRFVADASHELRTPLAAARTDLEVALAHPDATDWPATAGDLLEENRRMERLVSDLLFIARADAGTPPPPPAPVDLHEVVNDEASRLSDSGRRRIDTGEVASAFVLGRRDDLARVVRNLLDNAQRHASSTVRVGLTGDEGTVTLVVTDDGPGVAPEDRDRIFERFTRLDDARSRSMGGAGLGLAIARDIVERHGGRVWEEGGTGGARFVVSLPADDSVVRSTPP